MPRPHVVVPKYSHHKRSGQAYITLNGRQIYLGVYNSDESKRRYRELVQRHLAGQLNDAGEAPTVSTVIAAFWQAHQTYYGSDGGELLNYRDALRPLRQLFGTSPAAEFGPRNLKSLLDEMVRLGWCRTTINRHLGRVKSVFKWATSEELIPPSVHQGLITVAGLKKGRSNAREPDPVKPVPEADVEATLPLLSPQVQVMVQLQLLTGMRPGEVCTMRTCDVDTASKPWAYRPANHKTAHHGHERVIPLGPKAQELLQPMLKRDLQACIFSPADAETGRHARQREARATPMTPSQIARSTLARRRQRRRPPRDRYTVDSYRRAIARACDAAFPPPAHLQPAVGSDGRRESRDEFIARLTTEQRAELTRWREQHRWHPHQLRHTAATVLRREFGLEAAKAVLGHKTVSVTQLYAEKDAKLAEAVAAKIG